MALFKRRPKPVQLESLDHLERLAADGKPVLVDFFQFGCAPCQVMDGIVNELAEEFDGRAVVVKANVAKVPDAVTKFKIRSTPTFVLLGVSDRAKAKGSGAVTLRWRASGLVKKDVLVGHLVRNGATGPVA